MSKLDERIDVHAGSWVIPTLVFITLGGAFCISLIDAPLITLHARIEAWATIVIALIVQAIPFLVLGILVSSVLSAFVNASHAGCSVCRWRRLRAWPFQPANAHRCR